MTEGVDLELVDDAIAAEVRGIASPTRRYASGFPRSEDLDGIGARRRGAMAFLVIDQGVVVGTCGTHEAPRRGAAVELGWGLVESARGRGVGTSAVRQLIAAVRQAYPDSALLARTQWSRHGDVLGPDNTASEAILVRLGFAPDPAPSTPGLRSWRRDAHGREPR